MASFFEKLKKGMETEEIKEPFEEKGEALVEKPSKKKRSKNKTKENKISPVIKKEGVIKKLEIKETPVEEPVKENHHQSSGEKNQVFDEESEGQLTVDIYQTKDELVIQSAIAGIKPEDLDISIEKDIISIKGRRDNPLEEKGDYFSKECHWGPFSREMILPVEIDPGKATAEMKEGILTIRIPKVEKVGKKKILVKK